MLSIYLFKVIAFVMFGFSLEIIFTSVSNLLDGKITNEDRKLVGRTYLWMVLVYGLGLTFIFDPVYANIKDYPIVVRYVIYAMFITAVEFLSGMLYDKILGFCPWDYSKDKFKMHPRGYSKWTYLPLWGIAGLILEKYASLLNKLATALQ